MTEIIWLPLKPFSINAMYYGNSKHGKTQDAREWSYNVFYILSKEENAQKLRRLREEFNPKKHCYRVRISAYFPESEYFNKSGTMSAKCFDISNFEKPLIDLIFLEKYMYLDSPYGAQNLGTDDRYIRSLYSEKLPTKQDSHWMEVQLEICPLT